MFVFAQPTCASLIFGITVCLRVPSSLLLFQLSFSPQFGSPSWLWFHLDTRVHVGLWCQPAVVSAALWEHCDSSAWPQLSFRPQPKLTAERGSWGCCQSESWVSNGILIQPTVLEPAESLQCENLRPLWQGTKPERAWSAARGSVCASLTQHSEETATIICDLYKFQKWILNSDNFQMLKNCEHNWIFPFSKFLPSLFLFLTHRGPKNSIYFTTNYNGSCSKWRQYI